MLRSPFFVEAEAFLAYHTQAALSRTFFRLFLEAFSHPAVSRVQQLLYITAFDSVCQELFSIFSNLFFSTLASQKLSLCVAATFILYRICFALSRTLFIFRSPAWCLKLLIFAPSCGSSHRIAPFSPFVNTFFAIFQNSDPFMIMSR